MSVRTWGVHTWIHHTGSIWENATDNPHRRSGPGTNFPIIGPPLQPGQPLIILCYSLGTTVEFTNPLGITNRSDAWDFVVISDQDPGGYVADVFVNTDGNIRQQLGDHGTCELLRQRLSSPPV